MELVIDVMLGTMGLYLSIGVLFSFYFVSTGIHKLDDGAAGSPWHFKFILWPGTVLMWSILAYKLLKK